MFIQGYREVNRSLLEEGAEIYIHIQRVLYGYCIQCIGIRRYIQAGSQRSITYCVYKKKKVYTYIEQNRSVAARDIAIFGRAFFCLDLFYRFCK